MSSNDRPRKPTQYTVRVSVIARGAQWGVRFDVVDATSAVTHAVEMTDVLFATAQEAEATGWALADKWLHDMQQRLTDAERALVIRCNHSVARCTACVLGHKFLELVDDRFCALCHDDLLIPIRVHLRQCADVAIRRADAALDLGHRTGKENRRIRDASAVTRAESEVLQERAKDARRGTHECPVCHRAIEPGDGVLFQHRELLHLACYRRPRS